MKQRLIVFLCITALIAKSQTSYIGGVINSYQPIALMDTLACPQKVYVPNATGFSAGDEVLIIQMRGAQFDTSNTAAFGSILNIESAGNYEIAKISAVSGGIISLSGTLSKSYNTAGNVQLIKIPVYTNATVNSALSCQPWNGQTGGVLIFRVQNALTLYSDIDVSGKGFRGGKISKNPDGGCGDDSPNIYLYHYPLYQYNNPSWPYGGAQKGEGICSIDTSKMAGRGPLGNGGGGGNKHNTGGGGGSNYTTGGKGGDGLEGCNNTAGGLEGKALSSYYAANRLFMGGGGGCGDDNNGVGSTGENGGGIIIIIAGSITSNNYKIKANGNSVAVVGSGIADGAGGGGGGGTIFIEATTVSVLGIEVNGGDGGKQSPTWGCVGPGGGGGTGVILTSLGSLSGNATSLTPGASGIVFNTSLSCNNTTYGAQAGSTNTTGVLGNMSLNYALDTCYTVTGIHTLAFNRNAFLIYPDPASTFISWDNANQGTLEYVRIIDVTGKIAHTRSGSAIAPTFPNKISIEHLPNGLYFLEVTYDKRTQRGRFIKAE